MRVLFDILFLIVRRLCEVKKDMSDIIDLYCENIVKPMENKIHYLRVKIYSPSFFDWINRSIYSKLLERYENMLYNNYIYFGTLLGEEIKHQNSIKKQKNN